VVLSDPVVFGEATIRTVHVDPGAKVALVQLLLVMLK
jgi:hypothetical protein